MSRVLPEDPEWESLKRRQVGTSTTERRRQLRVPVDLEAWFASPQGEARRCFIVDISKDDGRMILSQAVSEGTEIALRIQMDPDWLVETRAVITRVDPLFDGEQSAAGFAYRAVQAEDRDHIRSWLDRARRGGPRVTVAQDSTEKRKAQRRAVPRVSGLFPALLAPDESRYSTAHAIDLSEAGSRLVLNHQPEVGEQIQFSLKLDSEVSLETRATVLWHQPLFEGACWVVGLQHESPSSALGSWIQNRIGEAEPSDRRSVGQS